MLKKWSLYFHTIKYLKFKQISFRLFYFLYKPTVSSTIKKINYHKNTVSIENKFSVNRQHYFDGNIATFLNHSNNISDQKIWNDAQCEKLWLYNLHYFDALNADDINQQAVGYQLLNRWVDENPPFLGIGWHSFPTSLRIVNIIKYALNGNNLSEKIKNSLYLQVRFLNTRCEYHLLGNHLFENFKALCFAGLFFDTRESKKWFRKGLRGIKKELHTQILHDGGHFELSPMYHSLFLEGLLDLQNIFQFHNIPFTWGNTVEKMLSWLNVIKRSDNEISYFNDCANAIAKTPVVLFDYAHNMGYQRPFDNTQLTHFTESGFVIVKNNQCKIICDVGNIGPDYLPGHGHADTLSFELMLNDIPVFVNLGTSCYGNSQRRSFERGTAAHNTVVVNQKNSSDVWSGFRVAKRARVNFLSITDNKNSIAIEATHDGYARFKKNTKHYRKWVISENKIMIVDSFNQPINNTYAYFHLHPNCQIISSSENKIIIQLKNSSVTQLEVGSPFTIIDNQYAVSFGLLGNTQSIKIKMAMLNHMIIRFLQM